MSGSMASFDGALVADAAEAAEIEAEVAARAEEDGLPVAIWREAGSGPDGILVCWQFGSVATAPPAAPKLTGKEAVVQALAAAADEVGVARATLVAFGIVESGLNPKARAKGAHATAFGLLQIINATWATLMARHAAAHGLPSGPQAREDLRAQCVLGAELVAENSRLLRRRLGAESDFAQSYAAHFLGGSAALSVLFSPARPVLETLRNFYSQTKFGAGFADQVVAANRGLFPGGGAESGDALLATLRGRLAPALAEAQRLLAAVPAQAGPASPPVATPTVLAKAAAGTPWFDLAGAEARAGVQEMTGGLNGPRIIEYFSWTGFGGHPDAVPWCGAFVAFCLGEAGLIAPGSGSARAADWLRFGRPLDRAAAHCIVVLRPQGPNSSGHVAFLDGVGGGRVRLLGGNQSNRVSLKEFDEGEVVPGGFRWPLGWPGP